MTTFPTFPNIGKQYGRAAPGSTKDGKPAVRTAGFGGRYVQRTGDGVNAMPRDFNYRSAELPITDVQTLETFLVGRKGYLPFMYNVPFEPSPRQFICQSWTINYTQPFHGVLVAKFEENFDP